jgi:hypothetical protein
VYDNFASSVSSFWSEEAGDWSVSAGKLQIDTLPSIPPMGSQPPAILAGPAIVDDGTIEAKITLPSASSTDSATCTSAGARARATSV